jgi:hypothetical protein
MVTMVLPPSLVRNHAKYDEDMGSIGEKNIGKQLGLVRIYSMQRPIKRRIIHYKTHLFGSERTRQRPLE